MSASSLPDLRMQSGPHVFVEHLDTLAITDHDRHHLTRVLRLRDGEPLTVSDGNGSWRTAVFGPALEPTGPINQVAAPPYELGLGIALTKAAKPELAVQKATELGIDKVFIFEATHSVARWDGAKRDKNAERLRKVVREAAMQSRRVTIPSVQVAERLTSFVEEHTFARADFGGVPLGPDHHFVLVGPEGGWAERERTELPNAVDLGPLVLRAETAAVVAVSQMARLRGP